MFAFLKSSNFVQQASKSWRLLFNQAFCCTVRPNTLLSPNHNLRYAHFNSNDDDEAADNLSSYGDHDDEIIVKNVCRPSSLDGLLTNTDEKRAVTSPCLVVTDQPATGITVTIRSTSSTPLLSPQNATKCFPSASFSTDTFITDASMPSTFSSSGVSSGVFTQPSSMEFSDTLNSENSAKAKFDDEKQLIDINDPSNDEKLSQDADIIRNGEDQENTNMEEKFDSSSNSQLDSIFYSPPSTLENVGTVTNAELLQVVESCNNAKDILDAIEKHEGDMIPLLGVACIHFIYVRALEQFERNSSEYNELCGSILTNSAFRNMLALIERNAETLNNFPLLTVASDLLYLRITLKKSTITTLLSHVDYENLNLVELRLLASCLHTPNIPMVDPDYVHNVAAAAAVRHLHEIADLYTLLSIMKCFGRYFSPQAKRDADGLVSKFIKDLKTTYPDGRLMASHMFDAFYRMEYAPSRPLQLEACRAINSSTVPLLPQDASAILRYFVKYGYSLDREGHVMLEKICNLLYDRLDTEPISKFTTNVKWLSVFYYYNPLLMERFIDAVRRGMHALDFVALSDVLDTMAQIYYLPADADDFFDQLHNQMMRKYPTLHLSNVKNVQRKLLLTAFHFSVFGRYPQSIIELALSPEQVQFNRGLNKHFLREFCESLRIERPDLLPSTLPQFNDVSFSNPKLYAFEKDVRNVLSSIVGHKKFTHASSPVRGLPMFVLRQELDGSILSVQRHPSGFIPPHYRQTVHNVAVVPLPRSRFCIDSKHAVGKTRHALRLIRAQGARVITVPHFDWDGKGFDHKTALLSRKIFEQRTDDVIE